MAKAKKIIVLLVEGPTEIEFYKAVVKHAHDSAATNFTCSFEWIDMHGIGNYKNIALRKFNKLKEKNPSAEFHVMLCIDNDVFSLSKKPPIDKGEVKKSLEKNGAKQVCYIEATESIEDWFLDDFSGVLDFLHLPQSTKRISGNGQEFLKALFLSANKIYIKGGKTANFICKLDIPKIMSAHCKELKPLCSAVGFNCAAACKRQSSKNT